MAVDLNVWPMSDADGLREELAAVRDQHLAACEALVAAEHDLQIAEKLRVEAATECEQMRVEVDRIRIAALAFAAGIDPTGNRMRDMLAAEAVRDALAGAYDRLRAGFCKLCAGGVCQAHPTAETIRATVSERSA